MNPTVEIEVATGGDPAGTLALAAKMYGPLARIHHVSVVHDNDCASLEEQSILACDCEILRFQIRRIG